MLQILTIMFDVIAPIFIVVGLGYVIGKQFNPDPRSLSVYLIYLFSPALVFRGMYQTELPPGEIGAVAGVMVGVAFSMMAIALIVGRLMRKDPKKPDPRLEGSLVLTVFLVNAGNYGIPLNTFAYGQEGGNIAILYFVSAAILGNIFGVYFASRGSVPPKEAILNVFKVPIAYASILGLSLNLLNVEIPLIVQRSVIDIAAEAAIPGMLALLGLQLSRTKLSGRIQAVAAAVSIRLFVAPILAIGLATLLGLTGLTRNVTIIQSSMPTAVIASALATQFGGDAEFVSATTLVATLLSVVTLSILIFFLGAPV